MTNAAGAVVERYTYDPYGPTYIEDPGTGDRREASLYDNPFAWTGQRYDAGVRLYHFPQRTYSPRLGRWLQRDPLGYVDGVNLYEYARSMPTFFVDPFGLAASLLCDEALNVIGELELNGDDDNPSDDEGPFNGGFPAPEFPSLEEILKQLLRSALESWLRARGFDSEIVDEITDFLSRLFWQFFGGNLQSWLEYLVAAQASYKDKWYGYNDRQFRGWVHRHRKEPGKVPDFSKGELDDLWEEWNELGRPDRDGHKQRPADEEPTALEYASNVAWVSMQTMGYMTFEATAALQDATLGAFYGAVGEALQGLGKLGESMGFGSNSGPGVGNDVTLPGVPGVNPLVPGPLVPPAGGPVPVPVPP